jgi:flagellar hook-basal body complex protein FliE
MKAVEMGDLLARMRDLQAQASGAVSVPGDVAGAPSFAETLARSVNEVNAMQRDAARLAEAFELGERGVDLVEVMVASQRAGLAFQAVAEVRNHLVRAYHDVMNMSI